MPFLARITNTFFINLINRLGVRPPPPEGFELSNVVQPVSIVDVEGTIPTSSSTAIMDTPFSGGEVAAPAADATLADTLAQPAGNYFVIVMIGSGGEGLSVPKRLRRRNAADAADVWSQLVDGGSLGNPFMFSFRITLLLNERLRISNGPTASTVGSLHQASIWLIPG